MLSRRCHCRLRSIAAIVVIAHFTAWASAEEWGDLVGQFIYDGQPPARKLLFTEKEPLCHDVADESLLVSPDGGLANVVVSVVTKNVIVHPDFESSAKDTVTLGFEHCRFEPHILAVLVSQTLHCKNKDAFAHNWNISPLGDSPFSPLLSDHRMFRKSQVWPTHVDCTIHPWERAYVVIKEHPYVAITGAQGKFQINKLPAVELEFQVWHERPGWLRAKREWGEKAKFKFQVKAGDNVLETVTVNPTSLDRQE